MSPGEVSPGEVSPGEESPGEVSPGEASPGPERSGRHGALEAAPADSGEIAAPAVLRRLQAVAGAYAIAAGVALGASAGWSRGVVLTLAAAASIVGFRGLEGVVRSLRVEPGDAEARRGTGWYLLRLLLMTVLVAALVLGTRDPLALILGLSALPLAFLVEAAVQLLRPRTRNER